MTLPFHWSLLVEVAAISPTLPGTIELFFLSLGACLPTKKAIATVPTGPFRLVLVIPAHDEEINIERCLRSVKRAYANGVLVETVVVADNCSDGTAVLAQAAGARVLERSDRNLRGKGYALDFAFRTLLPEGADAFAVIDADSEIAANFVVELVKCFRAGADAAQSRYLVCSPDTSSGARLLRLASFAFNVVRPLGRTRLGLSAGIYGNGFALSRSTLQDVPYSAASVVEDLEYHLALLHKGKHVVFMHMTTVYAGIPGSASGLQTQRARWEGGRARMIASKTFPLLRLVICGQLSLLEPLFDLLLLPLGFQVILLGASLCLPSHAVRIFSLVGLAVVSFHLTVAFVLSNSDRKDFAALATGISYVSGKLRSIRALLKNAAQDAEWIRTDRLGERKPE